MTPAIRGFHPRQSHGSPTEAGSDRLLRVTTFDALTAARALEDAGMDAKQPRR